MPSYSAAERRNETLNLLKGDGHVSVSDLSSRFKVSEVTIRKDLRELEEQSLLVRTHGGAMLAPNYVYELPIEEKAGRHSEEKKRIGRAAAQLVQDHDGILLDSGTTTLQIARNLNDKRDLTVTTNAIHIALEVLRLPEVELIMLGGVGRRSSASIVGPYAEQMLRDHSSRLLFLAGDGITVDYGVTTTNSLEAHINRMMIEAAHQTVVVADSSKFGRRGLCRICGMQEVDIIITDDGLPEPTRANLAEMDIQVVIV